MRDETFALNLNHDLYVPLHLTIDWLRFWSWPINLTSNPITTVEYFPVAHQLIHQRSQCFSHAFLSATLVCVPKKETHQHSLCMPVLCVAAEMLSKQWSERQWMRIFNFFFLKVSKQSHEPSWFLVPATFN